MTKCEIIVISFQVGDGTTTVTLLASEFLKQVKPFIEEGVHAQVAVKSFRKAANLVSFNSMHHCTYICTTKVLFSSTAVRLVSLNCKLCDGQAKFLNCFDS